MHFDVHLVKCCSEITLCFTSLLQLHLNNIDWRISLELSLMHHFCIENFSLKDSSYTLLVGIFSCLLHIFLLVFGHSAGLVT